MPNLLNLNSSEAAAIVKKHKLNFRMMGRGNNIIDQVPKPGVRVKRDTTILLYLESEAQLKRENSRVVLPNLHGLSIESVAKGLNEMGLKLEAKGNGVAIEQSPLPGTALEYGSTVKVTFKSNSSSITLNTKLRIVVVVFG